VGVKNNFNKARNSTRKSISNIDKKKIIDKADKVFLFLIIAFFLFIIIELMYFLYGLDIIGNVNSWMNNLLRFMEQQAASLNPLQIMFFFTVAAIFFLPSPLELFYFKLLDQGAHFGKLYLATLMGLFIAQHFNYFFGKLFSSSVERLIKKKKLNNYKKRIYDFGGYAIFIMHLFPLPYSIFNAVVGLSGYPYKKWIKWMVPALILNYFFITIIYFVLN